MRSLDTLPPAAKLTLTLALFAAIVIADFITGSDLTLRALYLVPVGVAAWTIGKRVAGAISVSSVGVSLYFDVATGLTRSHPAFLYSDAAVRLLVYLSAGYVLDRLRVTQHRLDELSHKDPLTGLFNRRGFTRHAERELRRAARARESLTIVHIDVDGFKQVNDTLGHGEGDEVLAAVGAALASGRATDLAARLGGDEFALLLPATGAEDAVVVVERVRERMSAAMRSRGSAVTFSIGVATFREAPSSVDAMLAAADALMYEAKRSGKHSVRYGAPASATHAHDRG